MHGHVCWCVCVCVRTCAQESAQVRRHSSRQTGRRAHRHTCGYMHCLRQKVTNSDSGAQNSFAESCVFSNPNLAVSSPSGPNNAYACLLSGPVACPQNICWGRLVTQRAEEGSLPEKPSSSLSLCEIPISGDTRPRPSWVGRWRLAPTACRVQVTAQHPDMRDRGRWAGLAI